MLEKTKDSVSVKKFLVTEGDWTCVKEVLGWMDNMEVVKTTPPRV